jgi:hypothetical protein
MSPKSTHCTVPGYRIQRKGLKIQVARVLPGGRKSSIGYVDTEREANRIAERDVELRLHATHSRAPLYQGMGLSIEAAHVLGSRANNVELHPIVSEGKRPKTYLIQWGSLQEYNALLLTRDSAIALAHALLTITEA